MSFGVNSNQQCPRQLKAPTISANKYVTIYRTLEQVCHDPSIFRRRRFIKALYGEAKDDYRETNFVPTSFMSVHFRGSWPLRSFKAFVILQNRQNFILTWATGFTLCPGEGVTVVSNWSWVYQVSVSFNRLVSSLYHIQYASCNFFCVDSDPDFPL